MTTLQEKYTELLNQIVEQGFIIFKQHTSIGYEYILQNEIDRTKAIKELVFKENYIPQYTDYITFKGLLEGYHATYD